MQAMIVEDYKWLHIGGVVGMRFETNEGVAYPGLITVDLKSNNITGDVEKELDRYFGQFVSVTKQPDGTYIDTMGSWASDIAFSGYVPVKRNDDDTWPNDPKWAPTVTTEGEPMTRELARQALFDVIGVFDGM